MEYFFLCLFKYFQTTNFICEFFSNCLRSPKLFFPIYVLKNSHMKVEVFPGGPVVKDLSASAGDKG